jgi:hypothetical protein
MKKFIAAFIAIVLFAAGTAQADPARLQRLYGLLIENEGAFAYLKHCEDMNLMIVENPHFMSNTQAVSLALAKEIVKEKPEYNLEQASELVMQKQEALTQSYAALYRQKRCNSVEARKGKQHFYNLNNAQPFAFKEYLEKY